MLWPSKRQTLNVSMKSTRETYLLIFWDLGFDLSAHRDVTDKKCEFLSQNSIFLPFKIFESLKHFSMSYLGPEFNTQKKSKHRYRYKYSYEKWNITIIWFCSSHNFYLSEMYFSWYLKAMSCFIWKCFQK